MKNFKKQRNLWNEFRRYCKNALGMSDRILDIISVILELDLTSRGLSVFTIADALELDVQDVRDEIFAYTGFKGFDADLDINPIMCYNNNEMDKLNNYFDQEELTKILDFIDVYNSLKRELDIYYAD